jgi:hypothetical protein
MQVAMYAVDSLRQLAMKFLERDELANYTFQVGRGPVISLNGLGCTIRLQQEVLYILSYLNPVLLGDICLLNVASQLSQACIWFCLAE